MYEDLTRFLAEFGEDAQYGEWAVGRESKGTADNPVQMPSMDYGKTVRDLEEAVYAFADSHPELGLNRYGEILERNGLKWDGEAMANADISSLDGQAVMALTLGAMRAERFCDGALLGFLEDGSIRRWLARLREIDEEPIYEKAPSLQPGDC